MAGAVVVFTHWPPIGDGPAPVDAAVDGVALAALLAGTLAAWLAAGELGDGDAAPAHPDSANANDAAITATRLPLIPGLVEDDDDMDR